MTCQGCKKDLCITFKCSKNSDGVSRVVPPMMMSLFSLTLNLCAARVSLHMQEVRHLGDYCRYLLFQKRVVSLHPCPVNAAGTCKRLWQDDA